MIRRRNSRSSVIRADHVLVGIGAITIAMGSLAWVGGTAGATFAGGANGKVAFVAICNPAIGQAVYTIDPNGSPPPTYSCPGSTAPNYAQSTAGATDSMPYFTKDGQTMYFSSNRGTTTSQPFALYSVPYGSTISGSAGSQSDGAVKLTDPGTSNDYAPTVSGDGSKLAFIRCDSTNSSCHLFTMALTPTVGAPVQATAAALRPPDAVSGAANRPELDPVTGTKVLYVDTSSHIHVLDLTTSGDRDVSSESGVGTFRDEYPDWNPSATKIAFDSTRAPQGGTTIWEMDVSGPTATAASLWGSHDPATEIEPIFAPSGTALVWTKLGTGSNIVEYSPNAKLSTQQPVATDPLTANRTNNSQPVWQPVPGTPPMTPEAPYAILLPGGALLFGGLLLRRRRRPLSSVTA